MTLGSGGGASCLGSSRQGWALISSAKQSSNGTINIVDLCPVGYGEPKKMRYHPVLGNGISSGRFQRFVSIGSGRRAC